MSPKPNTRLTSAQHDALVTFRTWEKKYGSPPSVREFADSHGCSVGEGHRLITILRDKGQLAARPVTVTRLVVSKKGWKQA